MLPRGLLLLRIAAGEHCSPLRPLLSRIVTFISTNFQKPFIFFSYSPAIL